MGQPELPFAPFRNEGLFAEHYLSDVLPAQADLWQTEGLAEVRAALEALVRGGQATQLGGGRYAATGAISTRQEAAGAIAGREMGVGN